MRVESTRGNDFERLKWRLWIILAGGADDEVADGDMGRRVTMKWMVSATSWLRMEWLSNARASISALVVLEDGVGQAGACFGADASGEGTCGGSDSGT